MADTLYMYKGYVATRSETEQISHHVVLGVPLGKDNATNRLLFALSDQAINVFVPDTTVRVRPDYTPDCIETAQKNTAVIVGVIMVDEIHACSGLVDKNGDFLFDNDIVAVEGKQYRVYFNGGRLSWEIIEVDANFNPCGANATSLYRLKDQLQQKAELTSHCKPH